MQKNPTVMAIIPAYNEARNIKNIIEQTKKYVTSIIIVDDGSQDNTSEIARIMNVTVIRNKYNMGKGFALKKGFMESFKHAVDLVVTLDADGQHDPSDIPLLIKPIEDDEADIVIGSRYKHNISNEVPNEVPKFRKMGMSFINHMNRFFMGTSITDSQSGFRAYKKDVLKVISNYNSRGYGAETEQLARAEARGLRIMEIPINIKYRGLLNTSKQNSVLHGANIVSTIIKLTVERRPLLYFGLPGIILIAMAIYASLDMLFIFNMTRYFSLPLALITLGLAGIGSLLVLASLIFYILNRIQSAEI